MRSINYSKFIKMAIDTIYRWISPKTIKRKTGTYKYFYVQIKGKHHYSSRKLKDCEAYVISFASKNNIETSKILKNGKHARI